MKILVVEDEHRIANSIKKGLEQEHHTVDIAYDGSEGLDLASSGEYEVILMDIMLPEMNGIEVTKELRSQKIHTPIIVLTAKGQTEDKVTGLDAGADDYLTKPFSFEELLARIRAIKRRPEKTTSDTLTSSGLSLDQKHFSVKRDGKEIQLTSKEFSLLEYLLRNAGRIVTKSQIITHVWDYDTDILPNTIEVYIRNLRKKIDLPFKKSKPLIQTVRGFGYKLGT